MESMTFEERRRARAMARSLRHRRDGILWWVLALALGIAPIAAGVAACHAMAMLMQAGIIPS